MYFYKDTDNNLIKSSRELTSSYLTPITQEQYEEELALRSKQGEVI